VGEGWDEGMIDDLSYAYHPHLNPLPFRERKKMSYDKASTRTDNGYLDFDHSKRL